MVKGIKIEFIPHKKQRIGEVGDYWEVKPGFWLFRISRMSKPIYSSLVLIHELVEWVICLSCGIQEPVIFKFDKSWYDNRALGVPSPYLESGSDPEAPYHFAHVIAETVERLVCLVCKEDWALYEKEVMSL